MTMTSKVLIGTTIGGAAAAAFLTSTIMKLGTPDAPKWAKIGFLEFMEWINKSLPTEVRSLLR